MSRWVSLNQARAKASAKACGFWWKCRAMGSNTGSKRRDRSAVVIMGRCFLAGSWASGIMCSGFTSLASHCWAPAGLLTSSHS